MATLTSLWLRLSNNHPWVCASLTGMKGCKSKLKADFWFNVCENSVCQSAVVALWQKGLTWKQGLRVIRVAGSYQVVPE